MPHEHNLAPSERSFHPFALFLMLPCGGKQFVAIVRLICNEDLCLREVRDNEESIAATLRYEYFIFLQYINKTQHGPDSTTGWHTFFSVAPCESVHFKGEGYAVTAGITSHFKSKLQQWPINLSAATCMKKKKKVYLFEYAVYQLCMKQLHTTALGRG